MQSAIEPEKIELFGRAARQQLRSTRHEAYPGKVRTSAISLAEASVFSGREKEIVTCAPSQLTISRVFAPHMDGEMEVKWVEIKGSTLCTFYVYTIQPVGWRGLLHGMWEFFVPGKIEILLPPAAEAQTLDKADMLVSQGRSQDGINLVYDEIDRSLSVTGPKALDQLLATVEPESLSAPVLLALITISGMARSHLSNWKLFLQNLEQSTIVKTTPALVKAVTRLLKQLNTDAE